MSDLKVMHDESGTKGRYTVVHPSGESVLSYELIPPKRLIAEHTQVARGYEGDEIGLLMLRELIADARNRGLQITPLCPFVSAQLRIHPEWADVFSA
ncbi:MAG: GNAT family N-acetyltransferase [Yoonia sp.]